MNHFSIQKAVRQDIGGLITRVPPPNFNGPDPFLLIAHHGPQTFLPNNAGLPFDRHPHKGFETITFIRKGALTHEDSRLGERTIHAGGIQWMTAGAGIIHSESLPVELKKDGGEVELLQLWLNLPASLKNTKPDYIGVEQADIPQFATADGKVTIDIVAGSFEGISGAVQSLTQATMLAISMQNGAKIDLPLPQEDRAVFFYLVQGTLKLDGQEIAPYSKVVFEQMDKTAHIEAQSDVYLLYGHAPNIHEPIVAQGPFVMNQPAEIHQAMQEYRNGLFN